MEKAQDAKLDELQRVRQLNLFLRSRMTSLDERLKRKVLQHRWCPPPSSLPSKRLETGDCTKLGPAEA